MYTHSILNPFAVRFGGPLAPLASGFREELTALGYATSSATEQLHVAAHLSRWLEAEGLDAGALTGPVIDRFLVVRRRDYTSHYSMRALAPLLGYLRGAGVAPEPVPSAPCTARERLVARFGDYLRIERGLSNPVIQAYSRWVRPFLDQVTVMETGREVDLGGLVAADVTRFLVGYLPGLSHKSAQMTACALRSFLRFLYVEGIVEVALAEVVPAVAFWKLSGLPQALTPNQVKALVGACDRSSAVGRRDFAVITCLYRLGLRCCEATALELDDIDWHSGVIIVHGKSGRTDRVPLPIDVGQAIVDYLLHGRPGTSSRAVFVRAVAPFTALASGGLTCIVAPESVKSNETVMVSLFGSRWVLAG